MPQTIKGPARETLFAHEPKTFREILDYQELIRLDQPAQGRSIITDQRRRRPLYFDGRFLAARDLTRDQTYFLTRQADLGRAGGAGVVQGLMVAPSTNAFAIHIDAGHGVTTSGELVVIPAAIEINLTDIPTIQRLDTTFGLSTIPNQSSLNRSGLFVVALRPVEFTANPIAAYPTSISEPRPQPQDGDIIEATAITLIPYPDDGANNEISLRRSRAAREIFVANGPRGGPAEALPLAMIALDNGSVRWVDPFLVRREIGAEHGDVLGLGFAPRANREAHLLQYDQQLQDVMLQRQGRWNFPATDYFVALPPAGRMPAATIDRTNFTQSFFPPEIDVELSFVPQDELRALLEESLLLPPIDLQQAGDQLESTSIMVLLPVPRSQIRALQSRLASFSRSLPAAAPNLVARRRPLESLRGIILPLNPQVLPPAPEEVANQTWANLLAQFDLLWYMRRRNLSYKADVTGVPALAQPDEGDEERRLVERLDGLGLLDRFRALRERAGMRALPGIADLLNARKIAASPALTTAALTSLEGAGELTRPAVLAIDARFARPSFGEGIKRIEALAPALNDPSVVKALLDDNVLDDLDQLGRIADDSSSLTTISTAVIKLAKSDDPAERAKLKNIGAMVEVLRPSRGLVSRTLAAVAIDRLERIDKLNNAAIEQTATSLARPDFGTGITRIERERPDLTDRVAVKALLDSQILDELDQLGRAIEDRETLKLVSDAVVDLALSNDAHKKAKLNSLKAATSEIVGLARSGAESSAQLRQLLSERLKEPPK